MSYERLQLTDFVDKWDVAKVQHLEDGIIANEEAIQRYHNDTIVKAQPDWNQNDEMANDYIKNRPCYTVPEKRQTHFNQTLETTSYRESGDGRGVIIQRGYLYRVTINGISEEGVATGEADTYYVSSKLETTLCTIDCYWSGESDLATYSNKITITDTTSLSAPYNVLIERIIAPETIYPLNEKYLPDTVAKLNDIPAIPVTSVNGQIGDVNIIIPEIPVTSVQNKHGDIKLAWSDLGETIINDVEAFYGEQPYGTLTGNEGTTLSVGDICIIENQYETKEVTIDDSYQFSMVYDSFIVQYDKPSNQYTVKWVNTESPPMELEYLRITIKGSSQTHIIDEKYIPDTIARTTTTILEDVIAAPTAEQYNALLQVLRDAGILAIE